MARRKLLRELAEKILGPEEAGRIWKRVEVIGDIAVIRRPFDYPVERLKPLAEEILRVMPHVKSVWCTVSEVRGTYRTREYTHLAGEPRSETVYKELGCLFKLDIRKVYVSPRLNYEHNRITRLARRGEIVVNMFAGAGLFSIILAKKAHVSKVYSIDINPDAYRYMVENVRLNRVEGVVVPILGDAAKVVEERLVGVADRVLMPMPGLSYEYLPQAVKALRPGSDGFIHVYEFTFAGPGENPVNLVVEKFRARLNELGVEHRVEYARIVRTVGPRRYQVVVDFSIQR